MKKQSLIQAEPPEATPLTKRMLRAGHAASLPRAVKKLLGIPVSKRQDQWGSKAMRRGVQIAKEQKQRAGRLAFIYASMQQANDLAKKRRNEYVKRRTARWRGLVESTLPRMFANAMSAAGLGFEVGSGVAARGR
jgi:hypothetical protein